MESPRDIKRKKVQRFREEFTGAAAVVLAGYKGLTVKEMEDLRMKLREVGSHLRVIKNTLAKMAVHEIGIEGLDGFLEGQVAFVFSNKDAVVGTKTAHEFSKAHDKFKLLAGYFDGKQIGLDEVRALASLPSREELYARLVGTLAAPLMEYVSTLIAPLQELIGTLDARAAKLEEGG